MRENVMLFWYWGTSVLLGVILFFPTRKFVLGVSINRLQRRQKRDATDDEKERLKRRATYIAAIIAITFAFIYNKFIMLKFFGGAR